MAFDGFPRRLMSNIMARLHVQIPGVPQAGKYLLLDDNGLVTGFLGPINTFFLDPLNGSDLDSAGNANDGRSLTTAVKTLSAAFALTTAGQHDTIFLVSDGTTASTARVDASFTWDKNSTHLIGIGAPVLFSPRARIAPTGTTTAFTPFFTISASNCIFSNIQWFHGFNTGTTSQICMVLTGSRNYFNRCHIAGMGDAASAASAGSRTLKIGLAGSGENVFEDCVLGVDTIDRTQANATVEFTAATPRNVFRNCIFPFRTTAATPLAFIGTGTGNMDRFQLIDNCVFTNHNTTVTALATLAASSGGFLLFKSPTLMKITGFGSDATTRGQVFIDGGAPAAATTGLAVAPTA